MAIITWKREKEQFITLHTKSSSYQMMVDAYGTLLHLYYGEKLGEQDMVGDILHFSDMGFSGNPDYAREGRSYSLDTLPLEVSGFGVGDYRNSMIILRHANGSRALDFRYLKHEVKEGSYKVTGMPALYDTGQERGETLVVTLQEVASDLVLELYYGVFANSNVITRAARLFNAGKESCMLERFLSMNLDMLYADFDMIYFAGRHCMERMPQRTAVGFAKTEIGSTRGTSSHHYNPAFILCDPAATEETGNCYGFCLAYSGSFTALAQKDQKGTIRVQMGIQPDGFLYELPGGEDFMTPQVIMSFSAQGLTGLSHQYHDILREHMCRGKYKKEKRPVLINNWEATYMDFDGEKLLQIAKEASALGMEMLVLDDGWFGDRRDDSRALGDWFVNEEKLGGSLKELAEKIQAMGMKFGLWFEPEMISENSELYRKHPEWALQIPGREPNRSRDQLVLDMSNRQVRDYLFERMEAILSGAPISYVKWDMNRSICDMYRDGTDPKNSGEGYHRYVLGVYELLERLVQRFPELLIEGCSGGGGRFDAGMLYYSPQIWCSDNTDAVNRLMIQYGTSFFYPIGSMGSHVSACPNHQTGRTVPFGTRGDVAMAGSFGYELDLNKITEEEKTLVKEQIRNFHQNYDLIHEGDYYRLSTPEEETVAWSFVAKDQTTAMVTVVSAVAEGNPLPRHVRLRGLMPEAVYQCTLFGKEISRSGSSWMQAGLTLPCNMKQYESIVIAFKKTVTWVS